MIPFKLLLITDWSRPDCLAQVKDALRAGPGIAVQHRHHGATDRQFFDEALRLREVVQDTPLFINGRLDVALAIDAHLHLHSHSLDADTARKHLGPRWLSASWHPPEPPRDVDLLLMSPVFEPSSKPGDRPPLGVEKFQRYARASHCAVFALGGLTPGRVAALRPLAGVATVGAVLHATSPAREAEAFLSALS